MSMMLLEMLFLFLINCFFFFFQAEDGIRDLTVTGVQTCALPISNCKGFLGIWTLLSGIVGAKLLLVLVELPYYWRHKMEILYNWRSAGVFYGGFVLACAVGLWYVHRTRLPLARTADAVAPGVALAQAIGRIGCFCAGCCYGKPTNIRWGVTFVDPRAHDLTGVPLGVTLHPTQIYHGLADLALFCMLVTLYPRKRVHGTIFWTYVLAYAILRFIIEFYRGD